MRSTPSNPPQAFLCEYPTFKTSLQRSSSSTRKLSFEWVWVSFGFAPLFAFSKLFWGAKKKQKFEFFVSFIFVVSSTTINKIVTFLTVITIIGTCVNLFPWQLKFLIKRPEVILKCHTTADFDQFAAVAV